MKESEIRDWAESMVSIPSDWTIADDLLEIAFGDGTSTVRLSGKNIAALRDGSWPKGLHVSRAMHCGIETVDYAEYLIDIDGWGSWPAKSPLRFKICDTHVQAGAMSAGMALLFESIYSSDDYLQTDLSERYATLRIANSAAPKEDATMALFYLNLYYLRPLKSSVRIHHLVDLDNPDPYPFVGVPEKVVRRRTRTRKKINLLKPVALYNQATTDGGDSRFLGFYRVLEFFFFRGALAEFGNLRRDASVTDEELLKRSRLEKELPQLKALSRSVLTKSEQRSVVDYVNTHELAKASNFDEAVTALYGFRNALVHAKESEITRSAVPDPFKFESATGSWNWIAELIAQRAIRRMATT